MTQELKEDILNYITNNITPTDKDDTQILEKVEQRIKQQYNELLPEHWQDLRITGIIKSSTNGNYILYGGYVIENGEYIESDSRGLILILDAYLNPIKSIYKFSSGTLLRPIQKMIQVEDGTFVAVDSTIFARKEDRRRIQTNTKRFIMLNNMSAKDTTNDYRAILRISYNLPYSNFYCIDMIKSPNSAHYVMVGAMYIPYGTNNHLDSVRVIELKANVGEANEWTETTAPENRAWIYGGFYGEFDNDDNLKWKIIMTYNNYQQITLYSWDGTNLKTILNYSNTLEPYVDSLSMNNQVQFINRDEVYFVVNNQRWESSVKPRYIGLYKYDYRTAQVKEIFYKYIGDYDYLTSREGIFITSLNGNLYINYNDNYNYTNKTANYSYQRLVNDIWSPILLYENVLYSMERELSFTDNTYNLISNIEINSNLNSSFWNFIVTKEIYNNTNYNGLPYTDYNSMIADTGILYGEDGILFARDIYNNTMVENTTTSTLQVPNTLLNDINITQKKLLGETNTVLINDARTITKNIYETLYINFIRSIAVKDEDTNTYYPTTATYINQNINTGTKQNCEMSFVGKVRINYQDNAIMQILEWTYNVDHYETSFVIDTHNEIPTSVDFMSNDETTIYITKDLTLDSNKYYKINQKLRIE